MRKKRTLSKYRTRSEEEVFERALTKLRIALSMRGIYRLSDLF